VLEAAHAEALARGAHEALALARLSHRARSNAVWRRMPSRDCPNI
jgi:hypothetical protein